MSIITARPIVPPAMIHTCVSTTWFVLRLSSASHSLSLVFDTFTVHFSSTLIIDDCTGIESESLIHRSMEDSIFRAVA